MASPKPLPSQEILQRLFHYEEHTGKLFWKSRPVEDFTEGTKFGPVTNCARWNTQRAGKEALTAVERRRGEARGHRVGIIFNVRYKAHRIIWKLVHDSDPETIDHIDGDPGNNQLTNLRSVSFAANSKNQKLRNTNTSGFNGVRWNEEKRKWESRVKKGDKGLYLGRYHTFEEACAARIAYNEKNGFHDNHGKVRA